MSFEKPNGNEALEGVKNQFAHIADELVDRKKEGFNLIFAENSEEKLSEISRKIESGGQDFETMANDFEKEVREFGKHSGGTTIDNVGSLETMSEAFDGLAKCLVMLNPENPHITRMSDLSKKVSEALGKKVEALNRYLNR